jgi:signal recognition particle GTPase
VLSIYLIAQAAQPVVAGSRWSAQDVVLVIGVVAGVLLPALTLATVKILEALRNLRTAVQDARAVAYDTNAYLHKTKHDLANQLQATTMKADVAMKTADALADKVNGGIDHAMEKVKEATEWQALTDPRMREEITRIIEEVWEKRNRPPPNDARP